MHLDTPDSACKPGRTFAGPGFFPSQAARLPTPPTSLVSGIQDLELVHPPHATLYVWQHDLGPGRG